MRTMSDGSFAKKFFRRQNLNELLPSDMLPEVRNSASSVGVLGVGWLWVEKSFPQRVAYG